MAIDDVTGDDLPPIPPTDLIARVVQPFTAAEVEANRAAFDAGGALSARALDDAIAVTGKRLSDFARILDFGCGPSRILRHLGPLAATSELHGTDIDADVIAWSSDNVPFATYAVGPHEPPLPYDDGAFDLIYNHSVFTHIDARMQDLWLAELQRVLAPGGIALLTVHSTRQANEMLQQMEAAGENPEPFRELLERDGILFISDDHFVGTTHPDWYHSTFHAPWYVYEHWSNFFDVRAHIHLGAITQDMIVLERRADGVERQRPIGRSATSAPAVAPSAPQAPPAPPAAAVAAPAEQAQQTPLPVPLLSTVHKLKRRVLRAEHNRQQRQEDELVGLRAELEQLRSQTTESGSGAAGEDRQVTMLRVGLYAQGERISILERELREEIAAVRKRLDAQERSST